MIRSFINSNASELILFAQRLWNISAGVVTILLIPYYMDPAEQGVYYTFNSLIAAQVFFELGVTFVLFQFASHEGANLLFDAKNKRYSGSVLSKNVIKNLDAMIGLVFRISGLMYLILVGIFGFYLFLNELSTPDWIIPWFATIFGAAVSLFATAKFALHEGLGRVYEVAMARFAGSLLGHSLLWVGLIAGWGLLAAPLLPLTIAGVSVLFLRAFSRQIFLSPSEKLESDRGGVSWFKDIFPLQWRISVSWISGYFIFNIYTPLIFHHWGSTEAGQYGIAITAYSALLTLSLTWISARLPEICRCIAKGDIRYSKRIFKIVQKKALITSGVLVCGIVGAIYFSSSMNFFIAERFPSTVVMIYMAMNLLANVYISSSAMYMRSFKEEPMLVPSVAGAVAQLIVLNFTLQFGLEEIALGSALVTILLGAPWASKILTSYFKRENIAVI